MIFSPAKSSESDQPPSCFFNASAVYFLINTFKISPKQQKVEILPRGYQIPAREKFEDRPIFPDLFKQILFTIHFSLQKLNLQKINQVKKLLGILAIFCSIFSLFMKNMNKLQVK